MRESVIEKYLVKQVKILGGEVRRVEWVGHRGAPDRLVMLPPMTVRGLQEPARTVWVELKATGVKPEAHQVREHKRMVAMGQRVAVIDSCGGVNLLLGNFTWELS